MCPGVRPAGWLRCLAHASGGGVCRGPVQYLAFAPGSSKVAVGFFGLFVTFGSRIFPNCTHTLLFSVWYRFFVFCCSRRGLSAAAAAKLLQSCPTLCDPIDGSAPGSAVPGILQARVLEWGAIAFSEVCLGASIAAKGPGPSPFQ